MTKTENKFENFFKALKRLNEANTLYKNNNDEAFQDSLIKRFEFTFELSWKTLREFMLSQGYLTEGFNSPRIVIKAAYSEGLLNNAEPWLTLLDSRNTTIHIYDEERAKVIAEDISLKYCKLLNELAATLKKYM